MTTRPRRTTTPEPDPVTHSAPDGDGTRVWSSMTLKINLGNYENVEISLGSSKTIPTQDSAEVRAALREMNSLHERLVGAKARQLRQAWSDGGYN